MNSKDRSSKQMTLLEKHGLMLPHNVKKFIKIKRQNQRPKCKSNFQTRKQSKSISVEQEKKECPEQRRGSVVSVGSGLNSKSNSEMKMKTQEATATENRSEMKMVAEMYDQQEN